MSSETAKNVIYNFIDHYSFCCIDGLDKFGIPIMFNISDNYGVPINGNYLFLLTSKNELELIPNVSFSRSKIVLDGNDRVIITGVDILW